MPSTPDVSNQTCGGESQAEYHLPESEFYVSQQHRLVYCPIQKVACSSLKLWWAELLEGETAHHYSTNEKGKKYLDHGRLNETFKLHHQPGNLGRQPVTGEGWFRFAFVRNPWARLVSVFINKFFKYHALAEPVYVAAHRRWNKPAQQVASLYRRDIEQSGYEFAG
ncbi:MAG: sulfotransferase family 2 domain-containing protein [Pirellulaceae bacterium]